ncbi:AmmeMemoRadiSam system protein A [Candidatus Woesearchaeota archaeon]|nr:AmmeMemoRadiSam system protein A [Candidatus Woesearchaeota archaeon]
MEEEDKKTLLRLARESIETYFKRQDPDINNVLHLNKEQGVFVTLHKLGDLRGCIGFPEPVMPLFKAVIEAARNAAFSDPRFPIVTSDELRSIQIEISVLSVPEEIKVENTKDYKKEIKIGEDGLIIRGTLGSGLLLPQVATENNFTVSQFLNCLCQKARLPFSAWEDPVNKIYKFQAEVFSEEK